MSLVHSLTPTICGISVSLARVSGLYPLPIPGGYWNTTMGRSTASAIIAKWRNTIFGRNCAPHMIGIGRNTRMPAAPPALASHASVTASLVLSVSIPAISGTRSPTSSTAMARARRRSSDDGRHPSDVREPGEMTTAFCLVDGIVWVEGQEGSGNASSTLQHRCHLSLVPLVRPVPTIKPRTADALQDSPASAMEICRAVSNTSGLSCRPLCTVSRVSGPATLKLAVTVPVGSIMGIPRARAPETYS